MSMSIELIFENGVFRPVTPVNLPEATRVFAELDLASNAEREEDLRAIQAGLADMAAGRTIPFDEFDREFRQRHGIMSRS